MKIDNPLRFHVGQNLINFRHTFHEDGFFKTLQNRARPILSATGTGQGL